MIDVAIATPWLQNVLERSSAVEPVPKVPSLTATGVSVLSLARAALLTVLPAKQYMGKSNRR